MMRAFQPSAVLLAAGIATLGCASTPPAPAGIEPGREPTPAVGETAPSATLPVRASFRYAPGKFRYTVRTEGTITALDSAGGPPRAIEETAQVFFKIVPENGRTIVWTSTAAATYPPQLSPDGGLVIPPPPRSYIDTLEVNRPDNVAEPRMPICGRDTVPPASLAMLLPPIPSELHDGLTWERRTIYAICQGGVPIRLKRTDSFTVVGHAGAPGAGQILIGRRSRFSLSGTGVEGQHNVRISGTGSAEATLVLAPSLGQLLGTVEDSRTEIQITASGRTHRFSQRLIRRVDPEGPTM